MARASFVSRFRGSAALIALSLLAGYWLNSASAETLQDALAAAYNSNPQLKAERARLREFDENYVQAAAQGRFQASAAASVGATQSSGETLGIFGQNTEFESSFVPRNLSVTGQKPLYDGGRVRSLKGQAKYGVLAGREQLRNAEQSILVSAATAYADVIRDEETAAIRRNSVRVLMTQRDAAQDRFDVGVGTRTDIAQADARLAQSEIGLSAAEAQLQASRVAYERATGTLPNTLEPIGEFGFPDTLEQAQAIALTRNPQMEAARYNRDAARFGIDVAKAEGGAQLNAQTFVQKSVEQGGQILNQDSIGVSLNLTIPIFSGGLNQSRIRQAAAAENRAYFEVRATEDALKERIAALWAQKTAAEVAFDAAQRQVRAAEIAFEGVQIELEVGTRDSLDVLNAEQEVLNARLNVAQARRNLHVLKFQILSLMGVFDAATLGLDVAVYDPRENFEQVSDWSFTASLEDAIEAFPKTLEELPDVPGIPRKFYFWPEPEKDADGNPLPRKPVQGIPRSFQFWPEPEPQESTDTDPAPAAATVESEPVATEPEAPIPTDGIPRKFHFWPDKAAREKAKAEREKAKAQDGSGYPEKADGIPRKFYVWPKAEPVSDEPAETSEPKTE